MSASAAKMAANRANAQKSTGPKTESGKERAKRNALKHGLRSNRLVVHADEREEWQTFHDSLQAKVAPNDPVEWILFNEMVRAAWNLRRIDKLEAELFDGATDPLADASLDARMDRYARYRASNERTFHRALRELKALQTASVPRETFTETTGHRLPCLVDFAKVYKRTQQIANNIDDMPPPAASMADMDAWVEQMIAKHPVPEQPQG